MIEIPELPNPFTGGKILGCGIDPKDYQKEDRKRGDPEYVMSRSSLMLFAECPAKWLAGATTEGSDATWWGSLMDCLLLDNERFERDYVVRPNTYAAPADHTKVKKGKIKEGDPLPWNSNAKVCEDWEDQQGGKEIVSAKDFAEATSALDRFHKDQELSDLLECSKFSVMILTGYHDRQTKIVVPFKLLIDILPAKNSRFSNIIGDLKSTRNAAHKAWQRDVDEYDLDAQGAAYLDAFNAVTGEERDTFSHAIQENKFPWITARRFLSSEFLKLGRGKIVSALRRYAQCLETDTWPDYDSESQFNGWTPVDPTAWMINGEM
jgi:hypothetical protein